MTAAYRHPASGRMYLEDDPAHYFARLLHILREECEQFIYHYDDRLKGEDYLDQYVTWPSDPDRIARAMKHTIESIDKAYTAITVDKTMPDYGLGQRDEEWHRKYGEVK